MSGNLVLFTAAAAVHPPGAAPSYRPVLLALDTLTGGQRWRSGVPGPTSPVPAGPSVTNGTIYVGAGSGLLAAVDAASDAEIWRVQLASPVLSAPAVVGGAVYVGCQDGSLYAVGAK